MLYKVSIFTAIIVGILLFSIGYFKTQTDQFRIGSIAGPETELMQTVVEVAKELFDLDCEVVVFQDYNAPNRFLNEGEIDVNSYQHQPYLNQTIKNQNFSLIAVGKTFIYPMGIYSNTLKNIKDLPEGAMVSIPNDPSNGNRALLLLSSIGLIRLNNPSAEDSTPDDIIENKKKLRFIALDAAQLPRSLSDVTVSVMNATFATAAGYFPSKDALAQEGKDSPYVNIVVSRENNQTDERIQQLMTAFHHEKVIKKARELFKDGIAPGW